MNNTPSPLSLSYWNKRKQAALVAAKQRENMLASFRVFWDATIVIEPKPPRVEKDTEPEKIKSVSPESVWKDYTKTLRKIRGDIKATRWTPVDDSDSVRV